MNHALTKLLRFAWRTARNAASAFPPTRRLLFPAEALANRFGRGDAAYAWQVFARHLGQLEAAGFTAASTVLEVGPGRNLGTSLLWWTRAARRGASSVRVVLWDVFPNCDPSLPGFWACVASALLETNGNDECPAGKEQLELLRRVASDDVTPAIEYKICSLQELSAGQSAGCFDLIYSHAALEHVWNIEACLGTLVALGAGGCWHSHRIDLADHGRRESNYIEMLEWSAPAYWLTMRCVPGAINRWRAHQFEAVFERLGIHIVSVQRELRERLPIPLAWLAREYRLLEETELRTTAIDIVGHGQRASNP